MPTRTVCATSTAGCSSGSAREQLRYGAPALGPRIGDEEIVASDKVILTRNGKTDGWAKGPIEEYLANGEVGVMAFKQNSSGSSTPASPVAMASGSPTTRRQFPTGGGGPLELAYALTVHKAQGSDFGKVFVVLPQQSRLMSRELLYTALTRSRDRLVAPARGQRRLVPLRPDEARALRDGDDATRTSSLPGFATRRTTFRTPSI